MNGVSAISLVLGVFSFIIAFLLYYSQTLNGKRICWYHTSKGKRSWLIVFNTSRRIIIPQDVFKQLSFSNKRIIHHDLLEVKKIVDPSLKEDGDNVLIDFEYMEPSSYMIIELKTKYQDDSPIIKGFLADGDIVTWRYWIAVIGHNFFIEWLGISFCASLIMYGMAILGSKIPDFTDNAFLIILFSIFILAIFLMIFLDSKRRIPDNIFNSAMRAVRKRKRVYRRRKTRVRLHSIASKLRLV